MSVKSKVLVVMRSESVVIDTFPVAHYPGVFAMRAAIFTVIVFAITQGWFISLAIHRRQADISITRIEPRSFICNSSSGEKRKNKEVRLDTMRERNHTGR